MSTTPTLFFYTLPNYIVLFVRVPPMKPGERRDMTGKVESREA